MSGALEPAAVRPWILGAVRAGRVLVLTVKSLQTGAHLTYRLRPTKRDPRDRAVGHFAMVDVLTGSNNVTDYTFLGGIYFSVRGPFHVLTGARTQRPDGTHGSTIGDDAPSAKTLHWLFNRLSHGIGPAPQAEVWHDGSCGLCGRPLTTPESVALGIGPVCIDRLGG